jgi:predicted HicB family RNase H-like nuclease
MEVEKKEKRGTFLLSLTIEEKKKLKIMAIKQGIPLNKMIINKMLPPTEKA